MRPTELAECMKRAGKNWLLSLLILSLILSTSRIQADPDLPNQIPSSANWISQLFKTAVSLSDISNPLNWVVYSAIGTFFYYKYLFKASLQISESARNFMLIELRNAKISEFQKRKLIAEMDVLIAQLKAQLDEGELALKTLPSHFNTLENLIKKNHENSFKSLEDYPKVEKWLKSREGKIFLKTAKGNTWNKRYQDLKVKASTHLDEPLKKVIDKANEVFELPKAEPIKAVQGPNTLPGVFESQNIYNYQKNEMPLRAVRGHVHDLRKACDAVLASLIRKKESLAVDTHQFRYWTRWHNIQPSIVHGAVTAAGVGGTLWLNQIYKFNQKQAEADAKSKLKFAQTTELSSFLETEQAKERLAPYYESIRHALMKSKEDIIKDFEKDLNAQQKAQLALAAMVEEDLKPENFSAEARVALVVATQHKFGERIQYKDLVHFLESAKANTSGTNTIFRSFHKGLMEEVINSVWSEVSTGNACEKLSSDVFRKILRDSEQEYIGDSK
jgi:hypothetical protein